MAAITICSDFRAQKNKVWHCFPIYFPWSDGTDAMIFIFWMLSFKPTFSLSSFTFIKRPFSSSSLKAFGVVPVGRGRAFGAAGAWLVGKFWNILCCSNWAFCKVLSSTWYSCNKCSVLPNIRRVRIYLEMARNQLEYFFLTWWLVQHFLWPNAKFLNQNCLYQGTKDYI